MHFNFNGHGSYNLLTQQTDTQETPTELKLVDQSGTITTLSAQSGTPSNAVYTVKDSSKRSWSFTEEDKLSAAKAFHFAGLFVERAFPELKEKGFKFCREEFSVRLIIGHGDSQQQHSSTYNPTKTFHNPHYAGRSFPELNYRLLPGGDETPELTKSFWLAMNALENYAYDKKLPESHIAHACQLVAA